VRHSFGALQIDVPRGRRRIVWLTSSIERSPILARVYVTGAQILVHACSLLPISQTGEKSDSLETSVYSLYIKATSEHYIV
jgi:hypothetical protein